MPASPFVGQITGFAGNFAPRAWSLCDGQLLSVSQNDALFSLLGTIYGGDGRTTFALPDLRGRVPIHKGNGPGLGNYALGQKGGAEDVTITTATMPQHRHTHRGVNVNQDLAPQNNLLDISPVYSDTAPATAMSPVIIGNTGGGQSHTNMPPVLAINWIIALQGVYPSRD